jgi:hypothetical protein
MFSPADRAYIRANFLTLEAICRPRDETVEEVARLIDAGRLPKPSYVLDDGAGMYPPDYFRFIDAAGGFERLEEEFRARYELACVQQRRFPDDCEDDWRAYLEGVFGVCLREVTPENIVRKATLVSSLCELLVLARPRSRDWQVLVRQWVEELDALERDFSPDYDRSARFERPPTRDLLVAVARHRHATVFSDAPAAA